MSKMTPASEYNRELREASQQLLELSQHMHSGVHTSMLTFASGALITSTTLVLSIQKPILLWFLLYSWVSFVLSILVNLIYREAVARLYLFTARELKPVHLPESYISDLPIPTTQKRLLSVKRLTVLYFAYWSAFMSGLCSLVIFAWFNVGAHIVEGITIDLLL